MNLNPLGIDVGAVARTVVAVPVALIQMPRNIGRIMDSARVLPEVAEHLARIDERVDAMTDEVATMRRGVDSLNEEVARELSATTELLRRIPLLSRRLRREDAREARVD